MILFVEGFFAGLFTFCGVSVYATIILARGGDPRSRQVLRDLFGIDPDVWD